jgi:hypothetical protein
MSHEQFLSLMEEHRLQRCPKHILFDERVQPCDQDIWNRIKDHYRPNNIFINIPYERGYYPFAATIIATVIKVGLRPHLAAFRSEGKHRLCKICEFMQTCKYCITDLSLQHLHNMPFELGYFCALGRLAHTFLLIDERTQVRADGLTVKKFQAQISNLQGVVEPITYDKDRNKLINELLKRMQGAVPEVRIDEPRKDIAREIPTVAAMFEEALAEGTADELVAALIGGGFTSQEE